MGKHRLWILAIAVVGMCSLAIGQPWTMWMYNYGTDSVETCQNADLFYDQGNATIIVGDQSEFGSLLTNGYYVVVDENGGVLWEDRIRINDNDKLLATFRTPPEVGGYFVGGVTSDQQGQSQFYVNRYNGDHSQFPNNWPHVGIPTSLSPFYRMGASYFFSIQYVQYSFEACGIGSDNIPWIATITYDGINVDIDQPIQSAVMWHAKKIRPFAQIGYSGVEPHDYLVAGSNYVTVQNAAVAFVNGRATSSSWIYSWDTEANSFASDCNFMQFDPRIDCPLTLGAIGGVGENLFVTYLDDNGDVIGGPHIYANEDSPDDRNAVITCTGPNICRPFAAAAYEPHQSRMVRVLIIDEDGNIDFSHDIDPDDFSREEYWDLHPKYIHVGRVYPSIQIYIGGDFKELSSGDSDFWLAKVDFDTACANTVNYGPICGLVSSPIPADSGNGAEGVCLAWNNHFCADEYWLYTSDDMETDFELWTLEAIIPASYPSTPSYLDYDWDPQSNDEQLKFYMVCGHIIQDDVFTDYSNICGAYSFKVRAGTVMNSFYHPLGLPFKVWPRDVSCPCRRCYGGETGPESLKPSAIIDDQINPGLGINADQIMRQDNCESAYISSSSGQWVGDLETGESMIPGAAYWLVNRSGNSYMVILTGQVDNVGFYDTKFMDDPPPTPPYQQYATPISFREARRRPLDDLGLIDGCTSFLGGNYVTSDKLLDQINGDQPNYICTNPDDCTGDCDWDYGGEGTPFQTITPGRAYWVLNRHPGHEWNYDYPGQTTVYPDCGCPQEE